MKKSSNQNDQNPSVPWVKIPYSVPRRARKLPSAAAALLYLICEHTVGVDRYWVDLTYRELGELLKRSVRTVARASKMLRESGDVEVEQNLDGSYRWFLLLDPEDVESDPDGVYRLRKASFADDSSTFTPAP